jgi:hypothetical protein
MGGIVFYIFQNALISGIIANNVIVETFLPFKREPQPVGMFCYRRFIGTNNGGYRTPFWRYMGHFIVPGLWRWL